MSETKTVQMEVTVTVTPPKGKVMTDAESIDAAMAVVSQRMQREFGRDVGPNHNVIAWADLHAEVSETDCVVIEGSDDNE